MVSTGEDTPLGVSCTPLVAGQTERSRLGGGGRVGGRWLILVSVVVV